MQQKLIKMLTFTQTRTIYLTQISQPTGINIYIQSNTKLVSLK